MSAEEKKEDQPREAAEEKKAEEEVAKEEIPIPAQEKPPEGAAIEEELPEDSEIGDDGEEIVLDEADAGEEKPPEPDKPALEEKTGREADVREEETGSDEQARKMGHRKKGVLALLGKKWALLSSGILFLALGASFVFLGGNSGKNLNIASLFGGQGKEDQSEAQTVLKPFFIPLPEDSEEAAIKLVISVKWVPETETRYKRRPATVRNEVYRYLLQAAGSKRDMVKQKSALEPELNQVFQHALAVKNVEVRVDEASFI